MRIGFDAKRAFLNQSGLGNYSRDLIRSLHQNYPQNDYFLYTPALNNQFFEPQGKTINIIHPPLSYGKLKQAIWRTYRIGEQAKIDQLDLYHGLSNELPKNIETKGIRSVITIHDLIFMRHPEWYNRFDRSIYKRKFRYSSEVADRVIATSKQTKDDLIEYFNIEPGKIEVIYQGCNAAFYNNVSDQQKQSVRNKYYLPKEYLLYVGTIEPRKNLFNVIKALHNLKIDFPLIAVGRKTKYARQIQKYIETYELSGIQLIDNVNFADLPAVYQMATAFIYPSFFEGFGIPVLEALVSELPVITSKGSCFHEVGGKSSMYIDPASSDEIGQAIIKLLGDSELQQHMIKEGAEHAGLFNNENMADCIIQLYESVLNV